MAYTQQITDLYQKKLGRAPDATELASEEENAGKYGLDQLSTNLDQRASSNGGGGVQYATPTQAWNAQPQQNSGQSDLYGLLMQRAQQGTAIDRNNPLVRQQVDPAVAQQTRASRSYLNDVAESAGPLANIQGEKRLAAERSGQAAGQLESEVIGRLQGQKADEIQQAIALLVQQGQFDKAQALQLQLAQMQDARAGAGQSLQAQSLSQSNDQFLKELALREADQNNGWDYRWATLGL